MCQTVSREGCKLLSVCTNNHVTQQANSTSMMRLLDLFLDSGNFFKYMLIDKH